MNISKIHFFVTLLMVDIFVINPTIIGCNNKSKITLNENGLYTLSLGTLKFSVSAKTGGRIVSFQRNGKEILTNADIHPVYYGGTFWLSPQNNYWPQYSSIDKLPYEAKIIKDKIRLTSPLDTVSGIKVVKDFSISAKDTSVLLEYTIENISNKIKQLAPWDVTRVFGGLTFFPKGEKELAIKSDLKNTKLDKNILWFEYNPDSLVTKQKLFSTNKEGWIAHFYENLLFIKYFPRIKFDQIPPQQGETEIFSAPHGTYIELENHGKYTKLSPGEKMKYSQRWVLIQLDESNEKRRNQLLQIVNSVSKKIK